VGLARVASLAMATPSLVDEVTVVNNSDYGVDVAVRESDDEGRLLLGRALPGAATARQDVVDVGDRWIFSFTRAGVEGGEVELSRDQLAQAGWRVTVPETVAATFVQSGLRPYADEGKR
jgi:hypothetical protein